MRILILSKEGDGVSIAYKLSTEGHAVDLWIEHPDQRDMLKGFVNRVDAWRPHVSKADLIICDMVGMSKHLELFQRLGKPTLCCNEMADALELNRRLGMQIFQKLGINIPTTQYFKTSKEAASLKWKCPSGYVVKASGNLDCSKTYVCDNEEIYQWALTTMQKGKDFVVQEVVSSADTIEVSTEGWFNGTGWISPFNHTWEEKRHMPGAIGKMTGCMGNVVLATDKPSRLAQETVIKLAPLLAKSGYRGPMDVNCIVAKDKLYALEFTARFGFDAFEALMTGLNEPVGGFLFDVALGVKKEMDIRRDFLIAISVIRDPYPFVEPKEVKEPDKGMPITGITALDSKFIYLCDVMKDANQIKYAAGSGIVYKATAFGRSVDEAQHRAYRICKNVKSIDLAYRNDIGKRVPNDLKRLREWGWL